MTLTKRNALRTAQRRLVWLIAALAAVVAIARGQAQGVSTTTVQGTVYLATGQPGSGTLVVKWPAFTTAAGQAITADSVTTKIGSDGFVNMSLAPNQGATPAGLYYTAVYYMSDGSTSTEYWVVPAATQATLAQVRTQVMPAAQAVQAVTKTYVDQQVSELTQSLLTASGGNLNGPLFLNGDPTQPLQAADKHYVDSQVANSVPLAGGNMTGSLILNADPTQDLQAADKRYVDAAAENAWPGAVLRADQFPGADFGAKLQACVNAVNTTYGGTCDARNFSGNLSMAVNLTIPAGNTSVLLPCATIATANQIVVPGGARNVALHGCAQRGGSAASGSAGGTAFAYSGAGAFVQVGDPTYAVDTPGFHMDNVVINTTAASSAAAQGLAAYRTQELDLDGVYFLGNANQTGMTLDGTGNYTGGTFLDDQFVGFQTAVNAIGHQTANPAGTDWLNASTFVRVHIDCPTADSAPVAGTFGINLQQGDGNTFTGGDVENCSTALHLGSNAQNNTIIGLRNENSTYQVVADAGSAYNNWITGGTMFTGKLVDNGTRNSFLDTFHRSFNALNGDWYGSQQDATLTNHYRLGTGAGNERGLLNRYQTDSGYRWTMGLSDATGGEQYYQILDELNNVYRFSIGQYNSGQPSTNNQTVINAAGTGAVVLNGSNNAGTGGVVIGSGGPTSSTVATIGNNGSAQFNGTLQVGGTAQSAGTMTVRNNADAEVDYYLWPGLTASQKGSFTYKDFNGNSQWYMVKDQNNNWALNSAVGGLDSFKAYQSTNSGDTYVNASNSSGAVRVNYENGSGNSFKIYGGNSSTLYASFTGANSIAFPGLAAASGHNCLQIDSSGYITNTGAACGSGGSGTVGTGSMGQIAYYTANGTAIGGTSTVPLNAGGTGATTAATALQNLGALPLAGGSMTGALSGTSASFSGSVQGASFSGAGTGLTGTAAALNIGGNAATASGLSGNPSVNVTNVTAAGTVAAATTVAGQDNGSFNVGACTLAFPPSWCGGGTDPGVWANNAIAQVTQMTLNGASQSYGKVTLDPTHGVYTVSTPIVIPYGVDFDCQGAVVNWTGSWGTTSGSNILPNGPFIVAGPPKDGSPKPILQNCRIANHGTYLDQYPSTDGAGNPNYTFGVLVGGDPNGVLTPSSDWGVGVKLLHNTITGFNAGITAGNSFFINEFRDNYLDGNLNGFGNGTLFPCGTGPIGSGELSRIIGGQITNNAGNGYIDNCSTEMLLETNIDYSDLNGVANVSTGVKGVPAPNTTISHAEIAGSGTPQITSLSHLEHASGPLVQFTGPSIFTQLGGSMALTANGYTLTDQHCAITGANTAVFYFGSNNGPTVLNGSYFQVSGSTCPGVSGVQFTNAVLTLGVSGGTQFSVSGTTTATLTVTPEQADTATWYGNKTTATSCSVAQDPTTLRYFATIAVQNLYVASEDLVPAGFLTCSFLNGEVITNQAKKSSQVYADVTNVPGVTVVSGTESGASLAVHTDAGFMAATKGNYSFGSDFSSRGTQFLLFHSVTNYCDNSADSLAVCTVSDERGPQPPFTVGNTSGMKTDGPIAASYGTGSITGTATNNGGSPLTGLCPNMTGGNWCYLLLGTDTTPAHSLSFLYTPFSGGYAGLNVHSTTGVMKWYDTGQVSTLNAILDDGSGNAFWTAKGGASSTANLLLNATNNGPYGVYIGAKSLGTSQYAAFTSQTASQRWDFGQFGGASYNIRNVTSAVSPLIITATAPDSALTINSTNETFLNPVYVGAVQLAKTGVDINTSGQVTGTHLASPLPAAQGGTGQNSTATFPTSGAVAVTSQLPVKYAPSLTPAAATPSSCTEQTFTVTGVTTAQSLGFVNPPASLGAHLWIGSARVSAANTVAISFCADAAGGTPPSGTWSMVAY